MAAGAHISILNWFEGPSGEAREARFWSKVAIGDPQDCWDWQTSLDKGYGRFKIASYIQVRAHRISWALHHRHDPAHLIIRHKCDRPRCCNPFHLEIGTHADNANDKVERGRWRGGDHAGEANPRAKLEEAHLEQIISGFRRGLSNKAIAHNLPVDHALISRIRVGRSWVKQARALGWEPAPQFQRRSTAPAGAA